MISFHRSSAWFAALAATIACQFCVPARAQTTAGTCERLVMVGHPDYPPFSWLAGKRLIGMGPSLIEMLAADAGVKLELRATETWPAALQTVMRGNADGVYGLYRNTERMQWLTYLPTPIAEDEVGVIVARDNAFPYKDRNSLIGKRGVTSNGESFEDSLDNFITSRLDVARVPGQAAALRAVISGSAQYAIEPIATAIAEARVLKLVDKIEVLGKPLLSTKMYIAFSRQSPCRELADQFNTKLRSYAANGTLKRLIQEADDLWDQRNDLR